MQALTLCVPKTMNATNASERRGQQHGQVAGGRGEGPPIDSMACVEISNPSEGDRARFIATSLCARSPTRDTQRPCAHSHDGSELQQAEYGKPDGHVEGRAVRCGRGAAVIEAREDEVRGLDWREYVSMLCLH